jgi:hypothetical protein
MVSFAIGQRLTASALQTLADGVGTVYYKGSATGRISTTAYAADPDLSNIPLSVGTYEIELIGVFTLLTTATQKIKTSWGFSGTWNTSALRSCIGPGASQTGSTSAVTDSTFNSATVSGDVIYDVGAGTSYCVFREVCGQATVTVAGNLSLQWAQAVSVANATNLQEGSFFRVRKLA